MTSYYLTEEASAKRIEALVERIVSEACIQWSPASDYYLLPPDLRHIVRSRAEARLRSGVNQESRE